jgi:photosystem II stability/assembly factor-like uncharacterized protein
VLLRSTTGGSAWTEIDQELKHANCLAQGSIYQGGEWDHDSNTNTDPVLAVFKSTNNGTSWARHHINAITGKVKTIVQHPSNSNILFAGGEKLSNRQGCLFKSTDTGVNWTEVGASEFNDPYHGVNDIAFDPFDYHKILVAHDNGMFISTNDGVDWNKKTQNIYSINCIVSDPTTPNRFFIGCFHGLYVTTNGGTQWDDMTSGMDIDHVTCMDFDPVNGLLYAGTGGGGVYRYEAGTAVDDLSQPVFSKELILYQNYPNPFNAETEIRFELPRNGYVLLQVYDIRGRLVRTLLNQSMSAGSRREIWDTKDKSGLSAPSGLYLVKLKADDHVQTIKVILQK